LRIGNLDSEGALAHEALDDWQHKRVLARVNEGAGNVVVPEELSVVSV
jgi:hypothetical protein